MARHHSSSPINRSVPCAAFRSLRDRVHLSRTVHPVFRALSSGLVHDCDCCRKFRTKPTTRRTSTAKGSSMNSQPKPIPQPPPIHQSCIILKPPYNARRRLTAALAALVVGGLAWHWLSRPSPTETAANSPASKIDAPPTPAANSVTEEAPSSAGTSTGASGLGPTTGSFEAVEENGREHDRCREAGS